MNRATGCNLAVPRNLFEEIRMPNTQSYGADAVFFSDLLKRGYKLYFDTASAVFHYYDSSLSDFLHHEFVHGRDAARLTQYKHRTQLWGLGYLLAGPILPFLKLFSIMNSLRQNRRYRVTKKFLAALPLTFCGAAAWTWGAWWGRLIRLFSSLSINRDPSSVS